MELNINGHLVGSPIQLVVVLLGAKQFVDPPKEGVAEGEYILGEASDEERAIYSARNMVGSAAEALVSVLKEESEDLSPETIRKLETFKLWGEILNKLFWSCLDLRLYEERARLEGNPSSTGIRSGWQVVAFESKNALLEAMIMAAMGESGKFTLQVGGGVHNCAECDQYDECDLPIKELRGESQPQHIWAEDADGRN